MKLKTFFFLALVILTNLVGWAFNQNLQVPAISMPLGSVGYFQIDLEDDEQTVAFDAEIELPDGFAILPKEDTPNRTQYVLNYERNEKMTFDASYPYKGNEAYPESYYNDVRLILMTADNSYIKGKTGWVVKLPMTTTAQLGTYEARIHSIHLTTKKYLESTNQTSYDEVDLPDITVQITVTEPEEIRYTDNQLFCNDIEIAQGEEAELLLSYNSVSAVYEFSANVVLPSQVSINGEVTFSETLTSIENFSNNSSWDETNSSLSVSGTYGGRRYDPAPLGIQKIATVKLNTASLVPGEYEIKISNQMLSNDENDYTPSDYVGKLVVKSAPDQEKCETPVITVKDNQLFIHSETGGATYHTSIVAYDHKNVDHGDGEPIELVGQYLVTSYASANGYADSEPVSATIIWNKGDDISTSVDEIEIGTTRMLLLQSVGNNILISGISANESIVLCDLYGSILYQGLSQSETFFIPYSCITGQIYIVKVGTTSFKYLF